MAREKTKLPDGEWFYQQIISMRHEFVLPGSDHNVRRLAKAFHDALREQLKVAEN